LCRYSLCSQIHFPDGEPRRRVFARPRLRGRGLRGLVASRVGGPPPGFVSKRARGVRGGAGYSALGRKVEFFKWQPITQRRPRPRALGARPIHGRRDRARADGRRGRVREGPFKSQGVGEQTPGGNQPGQRDTTHADATVRLGGGFQGRAGKGLSQSPHTASLIGSITTTVYAY
jgi:hypothetical protein